MPAPVPTHRHLSGFELFSSGRALTNEACEPARDAQGAAGTGSGRTAPDGGVLGLTSLPLCFHKQSMCQSTPEAVIWATKGVIHYIDYIDTCMVFHVGFR